MRIKPTARPNLRFFIMAPSFPPCHLLPAMCLCVCLCVPNVLLIRLLIVVLKVRGFFLVDLSTQKENLMKKKERMSAATTRKGKVFVVGTNEVITSAAVTAILCGEGREDDDERVSRDEIDSTPNPVNWSLRTRYYEADLEIHHHSITIETTDGDDVRDDEEDDESRGATIKNKKTQRILTLAEASEFSAVVMACKCDNAVDFSLLKAYVDSNRAVFSNLIAAVDGEEVDATRLLLVDGTEDIDSAEVNPFITQWCLLNNIEPVRVSLLSRNADDTLREVGQRLGDPQGVQRVVDALSATKWPGLILSNTAGGGNQDAATRSVRSESTEAVEIDSDDDLDFIQMRERRAENGKTPSSSGRGASASRNRSNDNNKKKNNNGIENDIDEDDLSFLGADSELISKIKAISERAQRGAGDMSNEERREAAFSAIEELMSAFKDLDPLQEFNPLPTSEEGMRREMEEVAGSFNMHSAGRDYEDDDDDDDASSS